MTDDHFIDIRLRKFLRLDLMLLARSKKIVQERHVEFEDFDKFNKPAVGDVKLSIKIKSARIGFTSEESDFSVIDIAGEFSRILIFFILRLKGRNPLPFLFRKFHPTNANVL